MNQTQCPYGEHGQLCERVKNLAKLLEQSRVDHQEIWTDVKKRAPMGLMLWLVGGIFVYLIVLTGWGGLLSGEVRGNSTCLAVIQSDLKHISDSVGKIERRVNRIPIPDRRRGVNDE